MVGRIAAILDRAHNSSPRITPASSDFSKVVNDSAVADALLCSRPPVGYPSAAPSFLRGPVSPSTNYECGMLVDGFDMESDDHDDLQPPYYPELMERVGLHKAKDLLAYLSNAQHHRMKKIDRVADRVFATNGVRVRPINMKDFAAEVERVWDVYCQAWSRNWGFVPMSREEFFAMGKEMKAILKPELVLIGEVGGAGSRVRAGLPDVNQALKPAGGKLFPTGLLKILYYQRLVKSVRVLALGVVEEYRTFRVWRPLSMRHSCATARQVGIRRLRNVLDIGR